MDKAESIIAGKRISKWSREWQEDVVRLTPREREVLGQLVVLVNATPVSDGEPGQ